MIASVRVRFSNGALVPLEPLDLEEGREVRVKQAALKASTPWPFRRCWRC